MWRESYESKIPCEVKETAGACWCSENRNLVNAFWRADSAAHQPQGVQLTQQRELTHSSWRILTGFVFYIKILFLLGVIIGSKLNRHDTHNFGCGATTLDDDAICELGWSGGQHPYEKDMYK